MTPVFSITGTLQFRKRCMSNVKFYPTTNVLNAFNLNSYTSAASIKFTT